MNPWVLFWVILAAGMVPFALIYGGYNVFTVIGVGFLLIAAVTAWYRPGCVVDVDLTALTDAQVRAIADDRVAVLTSNVGDAFSGLADRAKAAIDEMERRNQEKRDQISRLRSALGGSS